MDEREISELSKKLDQHEKLIRRIDFRIDVLNKKRKDVTLDMMVEIVRDVNTCITCPVCRGVILESGTECRNCFEIRETLARINKEVKNG